MLLDLCFKYKQIGVTTRQQSHSYFGHCSLYTLEKLKKYRNCICKTRLSGGLNPKAKTWDSVKVS